MPNQSPSILRILSVFGVFLCFLGSATTPFVFFFDPVSRKLFFNGYAILVGLTLSFILLDTKTISIKTLFGLSALWSAIYFVLISL